MTVYFRVLSLPSLLTIYPLWFVQNPHFGFLPWKFLFGGANSLSGEHSAWPTLQKKGGRGIFVLYILPSCISHGYLGTCI